MRSRNGLAAAAAALLIAASAPSVRAELLPAISGIVNVRDYGAHGNGRDDDTAALIAAIAEAGTIPGIPSGTIASSICRTGLTWSREPC